MDSAQAEGKYPFRFFHRNRQTPDCDAHPTLGAESTVDPKNSVGRLRKTATTPDDC